MPGVFSFYAALASSAPPGRTILYKDGKEIAWDSSYQKCHKMDSRPPGCFLGLLGTRFFIFRRADEVQVFHPYLDWRRSEDLCFRCIWFSRPPAVCFVMKHFRHDNLCSALWSNVSRCSFSGWNIFAQEIDCMTSLLAHSKSSHHHQQTTNIIIIIIIIFQDCLMKVLIIRVFIVEFSLFKDPSLPLPQRPSGPILGKSSNAMPVIEGLGDVFVGYLMRMLSFAESKQREPANMGEKWSSRIPYISLL